MTAHRCCPNTKTYPEDALPTNALLADVTEAAGLGGASDVAQSADIDGRESNLPKDSVCGGGGIEVLSGSM